MCVTWSIYLSWDVNKKKKEKEKKSSNNRSGSEPVTRGAHVRVDESTYFERRRGGGADPGWAAAAAAAAWVWLCAWWDSLAPACFGSLGGAGSQSPVSQSGLISQMQGIHSLWETTKKKKWDGKKRESERGREGSKEGRREKKRGKWMKQSCLAPRVFYLCLHICDIPPHSLGWSWQRIGRGWCAHRVCSDSSLNGIVTSHNVCARAHERGGLKTSARIERVRERNHADERPD